MGKGVSGWIEPCRPTDRILVAPTTSPGGRYSACAPIRASACVSPPTPGAGLRGIGFADLYGTARLVIKLPDEPCVARLAHGLRLARRHVLRGVVEGRADIAGGAGESSGYLARRLVHEIGDAPPGLAPHVRLAPL